MFVAVDDNGRIGATTDQEEYASEDMIQFDFPEDFDFLKQNDYLIKDNELVYSPLDPDPSIRISELKQKLYETDYVSAKITDYQALGIELDAEESTRYKDILEQREQWREEIRQLEGDVSDIPEENTEESQTTQEELPEEPEETQDEVQDVQEPEETQEVIPEETQEQL